VENLEKPWCNSELPIDKVDKALFAAATHGACAQWAGDKVLDIQLAKWYLTGVIVSCPV
jgi:hypothetical protein